MIRTDEIERPVSWAIHRPGLVGRGATSQDGSRILFALNWTATDAKATTPFQARVIHAKVDDPARAELLASEENVDVPARTGLVLLEPEGLANMVDATDNSAGLSNPGGAVR